VGNEAVIQFLETKVQLEQDNEAAATGFGPIDRARIGWVDQWQAIHAR